MQTLKKAIGKCDGSTLVGAVALCTIMAIGVAGLMGASRNTASQEIDALKDAEAYLAAEAGLMVGTKWLQSQNVINTGNGITVPTEYGMVKVEVRDDEGNSNKKCLTSTAFNGPGYSKTLMWSFDVKQQQNGDPETYVSSAPNGAGNGNGGLVSTDIFYGPVHFNNGPIYIHNSSGGGNNFNSVRFYGPVTVNVEGRKSLLGEFWGKSVDGRNQSIENVYDKAGIQFNSGNATAQQLDNIFQNKYTPNDKEYSLMFNPLAADEYFNPSAISSAYDASYSYELYFGKRAANFNANASATAPGYFTFAIKKGGSTSYAEGQIPTNGRTLIIDVDYPVTVKSGRMDGIVSVRANGNIFFDIDGTTENTKHLLYNDVNPTWGNKNMTNVAHNDNNTADIDGEQDNNWKLKTDLTTGHEKNILAFYTETGNIIVKPTNNQKTGVVVTAQLYAVNGTVLFADNINASKTETNKKGHLRVIGTSSMYRWWSDDFDNKAGNISFITLYDERKIWPVGVGKTTTSGGFTLDPNNLEPVRWRECNWANNIEECFEVNNQNNTI